MNKNEGGRKDQEQRLQVDARQHEVGEGDDGGNYERLMGAGLEAFLSAVQCEPHPIRSRSE